MVNKENTKGLLFLFLFFLFILVSPLKNSWGTFTEDEVKEAWRETGFDFHSFSKLMKESCHKSEKDFNSCLLAFQSLVFSSNPSDKDHLHYQLRASDNHEIEIIPYPEDIQTFITRYSTIIPDELQNPTDFENIYQLNFFEQQRIYSLRSFSHSLGWTDQNTQADATLVDDLLKKIHDFVTHHIKEEDRAYYLGQTYNNYVMEVDPHALLTPPALMKEKVSKYSGIGAHVALYRTDNETLNGLIAVKPFEGSSAWLAGLKKGDLISAVNDISVKGKSIEEAVEIIKGPENTQVKLTVKSFCNNNDEEDLFITRKSVTRPANNWMENSRFINLLQEENSDCQTPADKGGPQAFYVSLKSFKNPDINDPVHLCDEFVKLQQTDLQNSRSIGMIIDLRGNKGGNLVTVSCMLNTIIADSDIIVQQTPVKNGELAPEDEILSYHFTNKGPIIMGAFTSTYSISYNKHIIVLVDVFSGSASEIFAGTIQDKKRGWVIGDRTFGKGSVQNFSYLPASSNDSSSDKLLLGSTSAIYTLNSGRSPQNSGIIPDFRFSRKGEPIEMEDPSEYVSPESWIFTNSIKIENKQWEQNRPEEITRLKNCINKDNKMGFNLKQKIRNDERYKRPFVGDYQLELAKDILMCSPVVKRNYKIHSENYDIYVTPYLIKTSGGEVTHD